MKHKGRIPGPAARLREIQAGAGRGFTLIELLVVVGIIGALLGVTLPFLGRAREAARCADCTSNLRQIAQAFIMYLNENEEWFPPLAAFDDTPGVSPGDRLWFALLNDNYLSREEVFQCLNVDDFSYRPYDPDGISYGYNIETFGWPVVGNPVKQSQIKRPDQLILVADAQEKYTVSRDASSYVCGRHSAGGNILFCDGHVDWMEAGWRSDLGRGTGINAPDKDEYWIHTAH